MSLKKEKLMLNQNSTFFYQNKRLDESKAKFQLNQTFAFLEKSTYFNRPFDKSRLKLMIHWSFNTLGEKKTVELVELLKTFGYNYATKAGISLTIDDLNIPKQKRLLLQQTKTDLQHSQEGVEKGFLTSVEYLTHVLNQWNATSELLKENVIKNFQTQDILNPVYMMAFSGARGNISQVRQLTGMRGLMADPSGQIIHFPIQSNFREGMTLTEYMISCYGARKGVVDTALRTATSGYLTRRLVDAAHHVCIRSYDCGTQKGIVLNELKNGKKTIFQLKDRLIGRVLAKPIYDHQHNLLASRNEEIHHDLAVKISPFNKQILVRSPLTCEDGRFVCQRCYGWSLAVNRLVSIGESVGIIAAQSIGEPGTQLTMRTFHTGGVFSGTVAEELRAPFNGQIYFSEAIAGLCVRTTHGKIAFLTKQKANFELRGFEKKQRFTISLEPFSLIFVKQTQRVFENQPLAETSIMERRDQTKTVFQTVYSPFSGEIRFRQASFIHSFSKPFRSQNTSLLKKKRLKKPEQKSGRPHITIQNAEFWVLASHRQRFWETLSQCIVQPGDQVDLHASIEFSKQNRFTKLFQTHLTTVPETNFDFEKKFPINLTKKLVQYDFNNLNQKLNQKSYEKNLRSKKVFYSTNYKIQTKFLKKFQSNTGGEVIQSYDFFKWHTQIKQAKWQTRVAWKFTLDTFKNVQQTKFKFKKNLKKFKLPQKSNFMGYLTNRRFQKNPYEIIYKLNYRKKIFNGYLSQKQKLKNQLKLQNNLSLLNEFKPFDLTKQVFIQQSNKFVFYNLHEAKRNLCLNSFYFNEGNELGLFKKVPFFLSKALQMAGFILFLNNEKHLCQNQKNKLKHLKHFFLHTLSSVSSWFFRFSLKKPRLKKKSISSKSLLKPVFWLRLLETKKFFSVCLKPMHLKQLQKNYQTHQYHFQTTKTTSNNPTQTLMSFTLSSQKQFQSIPLEFKSYIELNRVRKACLTLNLLQSSLVNQKIFFKKSDISQSLIEISDTVPFEHIKKFKSYTSHLKKFLKIKRKFKGRKKKKSTNPFILTNFKTHLIIKQPLLWERLFTWQMHQQRKKNHHQPIYTFFCVAFISYQFKVMLQHWSSLIKRQKRLGFLIVKNIMVNTFKPTSKLFYFVEIKQIQSFILKSKRFGTTNVDFNQCWDRVEKPFKTFRNRVSEINGVKQPKLIISKNSMTQKKRFFFTKKKSVKKNNKFNLFKSHCSDYGYLSHCSCITTTLTKNLWNPVVLINMLNKESSLNFKKPYESFKRCQLEFLSSFIQDFNLNAQPFNDDFKKLSLWFAQAAFDLKQRYFEYVLPKQKKKSTRIMFHWLMVQFQLTQFYSKNLILNPGLWVRTQLNDLNFSENNLQANISLNLKPNPRQNLEKTRFYGWVYTRNKVNFCHHNRLVLGSQSKIFNSYATVTRYFSPTFKTLSYKSSFYDTWFMQAKDLINLAKYYKNVNQPLAKNLPNVIRCLEKPLLLSFDLKTKSQLKFSFIKFYAETLQLKKTTFGEAKQPLFISINVYYRLIFLKQINLIFLQNLVTLKKCFIKLNRAKIYFNSFSRYKPILLIDKIFSTSNVKSSLPKVSFSSWDLKSNLNACEFKHLNIVFRQKQLFLITQKSFNFYVQDLTQLQRLNLQNKHLLFNFKPDFKLWSTLNKSDHQNLIKTFKSTMIKHLKYCFYKSLWPKIKFYEAKLQKPKIPLSASKHSPKLIAALPKLKTTQSWFKKLVQPSFDLQSDFWIKFRHKQLVEKLQCQKQKFQPLSIQHLLFQQTVQVCQTVLFSKWIPFIKQPYDWVHWTLAQTQKIQLETGSVNVNNDVNFVEKFLILKPNVSTIQVYSKNLKHPNTKAFKRLKLKHKRSLISLKQKSELKTKLRKQLQKVTHQVSLFSIFPKVFHTSVCKNSSNLFEQYFLHRPNYTIQLILNNFYETSLGLLNPMNQRLILFKESSVLNTMHSMQSSEPGECLFVSQNFVSSSHWQKVNPMKLDCFNRKFDLNGSDETDPSYETFPTVNYETTPVTDVYTLTNQDIVSYDLPKSLKQSVSVNQSLLPLTNIGEFISLGEEILPRLSLLEPGQLFAITKNRVFLRRAKVFLLTSGTNFNLPNGEFVSLDTPLLKLNYKETSNEDIIQGIPKIEKLFEARSIRPGLTLSQLLKQKFNYLFDYYRSYGYPDYCIRAADEAREFIQHYTLNAIQTVYQSQGVTISDKHVEIIIKQMTSKVMIYRAQTSGFLKGDLIDYYWLKYVNSVAPTSKKVLYEPCILGITKTSLQTAGFISAASFQETVNVLTQAAYFRKNDFLFGLKENVILGNLIPTGTGLPFN